MTDRLEQLKTMHQAEPDDPFLNYGLALEYLKTGDLEQAISLLDRTIQLDDHYHYAYYQKARALHQQKKQEQAVATIEAGMAKASESNDQKALAELNTLLKTIA